MANPIDYTKYTIDDHAYGMACCLAFLLRDVPKSARMRHLAEERLLEYVKFHNTMSPSAAARLLEWAGLDKHG